MSEPLPISTLLSQTLVAFTIEFDNEAEHRLRHHTTRHGATGLRAPWLVSMAMWFNCMRFVDEQGVTLGELVQKARTGTNLDGMRRWGYVSIDGGTKRVPRPRADMMIRATPGGRKAREIWEPLVGEMEDRWRERFGKGEIDRLRESLLAVARQLDAGLPDCFPILRYGLFSRPERDDLAPAAYKENVDSLPLPSLLSRVLVAFAIEFERESGLSLAIGANVLRVLDEKGVRARDLPGLSGVSKESISMAMGILRKRRLAVIEADPSSSRTRLVRLTAKGAEAKALYLKLLGAIEERWRVRFGNEAIAALRKSLEPLIGGGTAEGSSLFRGLEPYPDRWRASVPKPQTLPHYPMVLHRGGFPDGS